MNAEFCGDMREIISGLLMGSPRGSRPYPTRYLRAMPIARQGQLYMDPLDAAAMKTWLEWEWDRHGGGWHAAVAVAPSILRCLTRRRRLACAAREIGVASYRRGMLLWTRSQKVVIIDRLGRKVVHVVFEDDEVSRNLLRNEVVGHRLLPEHTVPVLATQLDEAPYFLVQPYLRYAPYPSWPELRDALDLVISRLFIFYERSGLELVRADEYLDLLERRISQRLADPRIRVADSIQRLAHALICACRRAARETPAQPVVVSLVHGDLIPDHIVRRIGQPDGLLLVDWAESHRYSVFHDLFYLQFQNYGSDLFSRLPFLSESEWSRYYGAGYQGFLGRLRAKTGLRVSNHSAKVHFLVCLLEELDHRIWRLDGQYLDWWQVQAERLQRAWGQA